MKWTLMISAINYLCMIFNVTVGAVTLTIAPAMPSEAITDGPPV